jgi:hypothetical protein
MKYVLIALCSTLSFQLFAQDSETYFRLQQKEKEEKKKLEDSIANYQLNNSYPKLVNDSLVTSTGYKVGEKQFIKFGLGTMPDGSYKFVRISSKSMWSYSGGANSNTLNTANALPPMFKGTTAEVHSIEKRGNKKFGYVRVLLLKIGAIQRYECDLENAVLAGEIEVPEEFKPKAKQQVIVVEQKQTSVADELVKIKKLYDDGILTKEEYEAAKKKLLEKL